MIVFLTLCYVGLLWLLVKLNLVKLTLAWKLSPLIWVLFLLVALLLPMQWGAPGGQVRVYQNVVEIVPEVSGRVLEVNAKPLIPMNKGDVLFTLDPKPYHFKVAAIQAQLKLAQASLARAKKLAKRDLAAQLTVDQYSAEVALFTAQLNDAKYDLDNTKVKAPTNGYVVGLTLSPGQRVTNMPTRAWMSYVNQDSSRLIMGINQNAARKVKVGQEAEVTLKMLPGVILPAKVVDIVPIAATGQLAPSGQVPLPPTPQELPAPYSVVLQLDQDALNEAGLNHIEIKTIPGGAHGSAAIYTESVMFTHLIRRIMLRMDAWLNYVIPT